jgi:integrase
MPTTDAVSWTVVDDEGLPLASAGAFLAHLTALERSPETIRAHAVSLKLWFEFLAQTQLSWDEASPEDLSRFVAALRSPAENVVVLDGGTAQRSPATVNRYLAGVFAFYDHQARCGVDVAEGLVAWRRVQRGSYGPFLHHVSAGRPVPTRPVKLRVPRRAPRALQAKEVAVIIDACDRLRDRFLLTLLAETGLRAGQALGLRHADFVSRDKELRIVPRDDNANGARAKCRETAVIPITASLVRLDQWIAKRHHLTPAPERGLVIELLGGCLPGRRSACEAESPPASPARRRLPRPYAGAAGAARSRAAVVRRRPGQQSRRCDGAAHCA